MSTPRFASISRKRSRFSSVPDSWADCRARRACSRACWFLPACSRQTAAAQWASAVGLKPGWGSACSIRRASRASRSAAPQLPCWISRRARRALISEVSRIPAAFVRCSMDFPVSPASWSAIPAWRSSVQDGICWIPMASRKAFAASRYLLDSRCSSPRSKIREASGCIVSPLRSAIGSGPGSGGGSGSGSGFGSIVCRFACPAGGSGASWPAGPACSTCSTWTSCPLGIAVSVIAGTSVACCAGAGCPPPRVSTGVCGSGPVHAIRVAVVRAAAAIVRMTVRMNVILLMLSLQDFGQHAMLFQGGVCAGTVPSKRRCRAPFIIRFAYRNILVRCNYDGCGFGTSLQAPRGG